MKRLQIARSAISITGIALGATVLTAAAAIPALAQAFAERKAAFVDYSKADWEPHKACETLSGFKSKEIAQISR